MKILVTGAAGFIGSNCVDHLLNSNVHEVIGVDNLNRFYNPKIKYYNISNFKENFVHLDLRKTDFHKLNKFYSEIEYIIHFAAQPGLSNVNLRQYIDNNIYATKNLVQYAKTLPNLKLFINISTSSVYGEFATTQENEAVKPISNYGITKLAAEQLVLAEGRKGDFKTCSLRLFSVYGPRERPDKLIPKLIKCALKNEKFPLYPGSLNHKRSFTYVSDVLQFIDLIISNDLIFEDLIFNIGSSKSYSVNKIVDLIEEELGINICFEQLKQQRLGDQQDTKANIEKAESLGFYPSITIREGIKKTVGYFTKNKNLLDYM